MTMLGKIPWNKGKKMPHSPEWEANRLAAVRLSARKLRGIPTGRKPTAKVMQALLEWKQNNPELAKAIAIANLPADCNDEKNGNWKGGVSRLLGVRFTKEYTAWRWIVLERDGHKCRICGTGKRLEAHHIIAVSQCPEIALLPMNGVTLCRKHHYDNDEAWQGKRYNKMNAAGSLALIFTVPHKFQAYETVGNWQFTKGGTAVIFVSKMSDWRYELLVALHELAEVYACKHSGVTQLAVDKFDLAFEARRKAGNFDEPGDAAKAPYRDEHCLATGIERVMAVSLGVCWADYEREINSL